MDEHRTQRTFRKILEAMTFREDSSVGTESE